MSPPYFLRCLGTPELRGPGGEHIRFRTRKHLALLVFLAVERRELHRRDRLADLLWPDARPAEGRHSLATALSVIRGKLGPHTFESNRDAVRLLAPDLEVDLDRLARGEILGDDIRPLLEVAGFLEEFEVARAPEFMLWRDLVRAKWFPQIRDALILLMDRCRRTGDFSRIGAHADRLLAIDELSEEAIRSRMEACAFQGDRISAIRVYQAWKQRLREELDAEPSPLIEGMALRLRQRIYEPPGTAHVPTVPTDQWRDRAFIGRAAQYRAVYERWEETNAGRGRHSLVLGDSGIGKSTLVARLSTAAGLEGAVTSRVQCYEVERELPYSAVGTLVRRLLDHPGASGTPPEWLAELALTTPAVGKRYPNLPPARESAGEGARLRLTEAVHELASAVAEEHPVILVVDDVHLADDASVAVLHLLMRRTQEQRIMLIMTARQAELGNSPHASRLMESRESLALEAVELPPLTDEEMNEVVTALAATAGSSMPPAVRRALLRASAGVPMIVELLFDDWRAHGQESLVLSIGAMTVDAQGKEQREVYPRIFERTFRTLSPPARAVLNLAAILAERLNDHTMYQLVDLSLAQTLAGMAELERHRVLRDGGREMEFRNELLRGYAYLSVPSPLRRALHGLIADRLLAAEATGDHIPGLTLAWHCFRAGRPLQAEPYLLRGSREALRKGGTFEVELALTSAMQGLTSQASEEATLLLTEALQEQDRHVEALQLLHAIDSRADAWSTHKAILHATSTAALAVRDEESLEALDCLDRIFVGEATASEKIAALEAAVPPLFLSADKERAEKFIHWASALEGTAKGLEEHARVAMLLALCSWLTRRSDEASALITRLDQLSKELRSLGFANLTTWRALNITSSLHTSSGRYREALEICLPAYTLAHRLGNEPKMGSAAMNIAMCHGRLGAYPQQVLWADRALSHLSTPDVAWRRSQALYYRSFAMCLMGENRKALGNIEDIERNGSNEGPRWSTQSRQLMTADILIAAGEESRACEVANRCLRQTGGAPMMRGYAGMVARWIARSGAEGGQYDSASGMLLKLCDELESHDYVDQAEILCARLWLEERQGGGWNAGRALLADRLARLPPAVETQLHRLRILS
jgi:DNA-binding SARP family transcriptional activator/tetratricopeptide (TPR) repeat protein